MDEADYAQQNDEFFRQQALRIHFRRSKVVEVDVSGPRRCFDCGEEIGEARMKANPAAVRCVSCQEKKERNHGR